MAVMSEYCKAYTVDQLRQFPSWSESVPPSTVRVEKGSGGEDAGRPATGELSYYFLHDDYTVTAGIFRDQRIAFDRVTDEWKNFCANVLEFHPPSVPGRA